MAKVNQGQGWKTATTQTGTEVYYDPDEGRWEFARGVPIGRAARDHIMGQQQPEPTPVVQPPVVEEAPPPQPPPVVKPPSGPRGAPTTGVSGGGSSSVDRATYETAVNTGGGSPVVNTGTTGTTAPVAEEAAGPTWDQVYADALDIEGRKARTEDPKQDPRVLAGTHYLGWNNAVLPYVQNVQSAEWGGIVTGNEAYDSLTPREKMEANKRYGSTIGLGGVNRAFTKHNADSAQKSVDALNAYREYEEAMKQPWGTPRRDAVIDLWRDGKITYDEYRAGAHNVSPNQDGVYDSIDDQSFDGRYGSAGFSASGLPVPQSGFTQPGGGAPQQAAPQQLAAAPQTGGFTPAPYGNPQTGGNSHGQQDWRSFYDLAMGGGSMQAPATGATGDWRSFYNQSMQATPSVAPQSDWDWRAYYDQAMRGGT